MVKDKSSNSRIFDEDGYRKVIIHIVIVKPDQSQIEVKQPPTFSHYLFAQRAACICVKSEDETEVNYSLNQLNNEPKDDISEQKFLSVFKFFLSKQQKFFDVSHLKFRRIVYFLPFVNFPNRFCLFLRVNIPKDG